MDIHSLQVILYVALLAGLYSLVSIETAVTLLALITVQDFTLYKCINLLPPLPVNFPHPHGSVYETLQGVVENSYVLTV